MRLSPSSTENGKRVVDLYPPSMRRIQSITSPMILKGFGFMTYARSFASACAAHASRHSRLTSISCKKDRVLLPLHERISLMATSSSILYRIHNVKTTFV